MDKDVEPSDTFSHIKLILQWVRRDILRDDSLIMECGRESLLATHWSNVLCFMSACDFENRCCTFIILGSGQRSEKGKRVLCFEKERQEIETGNYPLPSLAFWDTEGTQKAARGGSKPCFTRISLVGVFYVRDLMFCPWHPAFYVCVCVCVCVCVYIYIYFSFVMSIFHKNTYR